MGRKNLADQRRADIVQAFYRCVVKEGFSKSSIRKVAREAGVTPSTLHHYFKDRNEIISETVDHSTNQLANGFDLKKQLPDSENSPLGQGLEYLFSPAMINSEDNGFFLECLAEARHNPEVRASLAKMFDFFRQAIIHHLDGTESFKHLDDRQKNMFASIIIAMHEGIELQWFADPDAVSLDDALGFARMILE